jgi:serine/threonine protein kinase
MVGRTVLQYQFLEKLGSGGMGEIYKAQDTKLNRFVAIKVLPADKSGEPERRRRFIQEAQAASALNHPNIITIHDIVSEGETQYMVMEFVAGRTLLDLIPTGGMRVTQVLQYATQMADALTAAHAAGIVHRDFKPANVMVTNSGLVKVLDFGLAKLTERGNAFDPDATKSEAPITVEGSIMGTVSYMSPEQAEGKRVDARSDIFSFGSVIYEMVTGRRAFHGDSGISTLTSVLRDDIKPIAEVVPDVPPLLEVIIARCLNKDPEARWQTMKEVGDALSSLRRTLDSGIFDRPAAVTASIAPSRPPVAVVPPAGPSTPVQTPPAQTPPVATPPKAAIPERKPAAATAGDPGKKSPLAPILALLGLLVVVGAGAGGWWWYTHRSQPQPVANNAPPAQVTAPAPTTPAPAPDDKGTPLAAPADDANKAAATKAAGKQPAVKKSTAPEVKPATPPPPASTPQPKENVTSPPKQTLPPPPPKPAPPPPVVTVPVTVGDALPFRITLDDDVPADAEGGLELHFTVADGLKVGDNVVVAKGARVTGAVIGEVGKKILGIGSKKLNFRLTETVGVDGKKLNLRATAGHAGKGPVARPFDTGKGSKSKELAAAKGTEYYAYTDGEQTVNVKK